MGARRPAAPRGAALRALAPPLAAAAGLLAPAAWLGAASSMQASATFLPRAAAPAPARRSAVWCLGGRRAASTQRVRGRGGLRATRLRLRASDVASSDVASGPADCGAMLTALRGALLPLNTRKSAWRLPGRECRGFTLGLSLGYGRGLVMPTAATWDWPDLVRVLCAACREADPDFRFTSIQVNLNTKYLMHTDGIDAGPSRMIACGNFTAGRMWLHDSSADSWSAIDVREKWIAFDGREFHLTEDWDGPERWSLVYFSNPTWRKARRSRKGRQTMMQLMELGFPWPNKEDLFQEGLPREAARREAAARGLPQHLQESSLPRGR